jgi:hypothetical protein
MAVDEDLAERMRAILTGTGVLREVRMFGGLCFMLNGNMVAGTSKRGLLVRVGKDQQPDALARPDAKPMEMAGRSMAGYVFVDPGLGCRLSGVDNATRPPAGIKGCRSVERRRAPRGSTRHAAADFLRADAGELDISRNGLWILSEIRRRQ